MATTVFSAISIVNCWNNHRTYCMYMCMFLMCYCLTDSIDVGDAIILSEPEIAEANQLVAALMFKLPTVLLSLNVND